MSSVVVGLRLRRRVVINPPAAAALQRQTASTTYFTRENRGVLTEERTPDGNRYFHLYDGLGNVVALTDSTGNVVNTYTYDPYGQTLSSTGSVANPWRFGGSYGAYSDSGVGNLLKIGQRYDDPSAGRLSRTPGAA